MRLFIALNFSRDLRERIATDVLTPLRTLLPDVRWVQAETLHVTLLFLEKRSHAEAEEAKAVLQKVAVLQEPFTASLTGLGVFPNPARPRVLWLGVESAAILELHRVLRREHARLGTPLEERAFSPHITLGRVPPRAKAPAPRALTQALFELHFTAPVRFGSVELMKSELAPRRPHYTVLFTAPLSLP